MEVEEEEGTEKLKAAASGVVRVDFLVDIEEEMIQGDRLIWVVALNGGGALVSPRVIREFRGIYGGDLNRLVRDATRNQRVSEYSSIEEDEEEEEEERGEEQRY